MNNARTAIKENNVELLKRELFYVLKYKEDEDNVVPKCLQIAVGESSFDIIDYIGTIWNETHPLKNYNFYYNVLSYSLREGTFNLEVFFKYLPYCEDLKSTVFPMIERYIVDKTFPKSDRLKVLKYMTHFNIIASRHYYKVTLLYNSITGN